jgi:hypothetical protein
MSHVTYKTSPWAEIVKLYSKAVIGPGSRFEPMFILLQQIASSRYADRLYGNKSMLDLLIVQTPEYDPDGEILKISYAPDRCEFTFEHQETSSTLYTRWTRKCTVEHGFSTFERFLQLKNWFVVEKPSIGPS